MNDPITRRSVLVASAATAFMTMSFARAAPGLGQRRQDIEIVRRTLDLHPGLLRYQSAQQLSDRFARFGRIFAGASSLEEQFLALSAFTATIRCGHTQCNPYNQSKSVVATLLERPTRLPFEFEWIDRRMIVRADRGASGLFEPGTEIVSINGLAAGDLLDRLLAFARADGGNDGKRIDQMAMRNIDRFETFDIFQGLLLPPAKGHFRCRYRTPAGRSDEIDLVAFTPTQRRATRHVLETDGTSAPIWTWRVEKGVAILGMPSWVVYNNKWDWQSWLDERLGQLNGAKGLIIDLRDNEGGNDCGDAILARLAPADLYFPTYRRLVRYRRTPADLDPYLDTWDDSFRSIGTAATAASDGFFELESTEIDKITAKAPRLTVPVAALIGPTCSSATFQFAHKAKQTGLVRLFGQQSGGNLRGINGSGFFFVRLPESGLEFDLPIVGNFPRTPQPDRGVLPDVLIGKSQSDVASGRDRCFEAALTWILRDA
ncbi:S41 family peptidase [Sphingomonas sp. GlSt437]|uniref:S41 family peptidase n=1 Tax=Sphingomonas sp. GlSt437 TaxID=3389970 RepID=UPI003A872313